MQGDPGRRRVGIVRVVISDDDPRVRDDFGALLADEDGIEVVATVADGRAAVEAGGRLDPDVVVMDVRMPIMNGIDATRALRADERLRCKVLVMTTFDFDEYVLGAIRAGASGFLLKDQAPEQLAPAIRTIAAGDAVVAPRATARLIAELVEPANPEDRSTPLTDREVAIVRLLAAGMSNDEIAAHAYISRATVKSHVSSILLKLGLSSRIQIVVWAFENGVAARRLTGGDRSPS